MTNKEKSELPPPEPKHNGNGGSKAVEKVEQQPVPAPPPELPPSEPSGSTDISPYGSRLIIPTPGRKAGKEPTVISPSREIHYLVDKFYGDYGAQVLLDVIGHVVFLDRRYIILLRSKDTLMTRCFEENRQPTQREVWRAAIRVQKAINAIADAVSMSKHAHLVVASMLQMMSKANFTVSSQQSLKPSESMLPPSSSSTSISYQEREK